MRIHVILPARRGSTRLPEKMLADVGGEPLVVRSWRRACLVPGVASVTVATDCADIAGAVRAAGGLALRTGVHANGTQRVAAAARVLADWDPVVRGDVIVNVQGDEPFLDPLTVSAVAAPLLGAGAPGALRMPPRLRPEGARAASDRPRPRRSPSHGDREGGRAEAPPQDFQAPSDTTALPWERPLPAIFTAAAPLDSAEAGDTARVKVVTDGEGRALYFSREAIPHGGPFRVHVGLYAFGWEALQRVAGLAMPGHLDGERLEQLAWLHRGESIGVVDVPDAGRSVDTPADLAWARDRLATGGRRG